MNTNPHDSPDNPAFAELVRKAAQSHAEASLDDANIARPLPQSNVGDLIDKLQTYPPDYRVIIRDASGAILSDDVHVSAYVAGAFKPGEVSIFIR